MLERTLPFEFKAKTSLLFSPFGVHCTITIPLSRRLVNTPAMEG